MKTLSLILIAAILCSISGCQNSEDAGVDRGYRWLQRGNYNSAINTFTTVLEKNPTNKFALGGRGDSYAKKKEYEKALEDYDKGIKLYPSWSTLYYHRGVCWQEYAEFRGWYDEDKLAKALTDYTKSISLYPESTAAYINRAFINNMMGNYDLALADYDKILKLTPDDKKAKEQRAKTLKAIQEGTKPQVREDLPPTE